MSDPHRSAMHRAELRITLSLASIFALRMFGLFMVLPVFAVYGTELSGASPLLIGTAIGIYGLMQALLQIPFGLLSDKYGRQPLLLVGLALFIVGGCVAALSDTIYGVIVGRSLQGAGAVASVIMATIGDAVSDQHRTRAMAAVGMSVGASFVLALILGPVLTSVVGLSGLFWVSSVMGVAAFVVAAWLPISAPVQLEMPNVSERFKRVLGDRVLWQLNGGILILHLVLTAMFVVLPQMLVKLGMPLQQHSMLYLGVLLGGIAAMVPLIIRAERKGAIPVKRLGLMLLALSLLMLSLVGTQLWWLIAALLVFFAAFNLLEALLPSMVSRAAPAGARGAAMGVYSSHQFFGVFLGGQLGGLIYHWWGASSVFVIAALMVVGWMLLIRTMDELPKYESRVLPLNDAVNEQQLLQSLLKVVGVKEAVYLRDQHIAVVKVDSELLNESELSALAGIEQT